MRSVAIEFDWLIIYVFIVLLAAIVGSFYILFSRRCKDCKKSAIFMLFVLMMIFGNAMATAFMLQCISRYMIYNFPFFYIAILVMGREVFLERKRGKV